MYLFARLEVSVEHRTEKAGQSGYTVVISVVLCYITLAYKCFKLGHKLGCLDEFALGFGIATAIHGYGAYYFAISVFRT